MQSLWGSEVEGDGEKLLSKYCHDEILKVLQQIKLQITEPQVS